MLETQPEPSQVLSLGLHFFLLYSLSGSVIALLEISRSKAAVVAHCLLSSFHRNTTHVSSWLVATQNKGYFPNLCSWVLAKGKCKLMCHVAAFENIVASFPLPLFALFLPPSCCWECECDDWSLSCHPGPQGWGNTPERLNFVSKEPESLRASGSRAVLNPTLPTSGLMHKKLSINFL